MQYYPLKFEPILKEVIWGGSEIARFKQLQQPMEHIGESWEISHLPNDVSVVANGLYAGKTLGFLMQNFRDRFVGEQVWNRFGETFPLLVKLIDAKKDLSIQVHPDDVLGRLRHNSPGKTEMWYVIRAEPGSRLVSGFRRKVDADEYRSLVASNQIEEVLQTHEVHAGDVFFLPAGRVHAIGGGILLAEIQQTSAITYRIYDYNRTDLQGNKRELHTELALEALDFTPLLGAKVDYLSRMNEVVPLVSCSYFTCNQIHIQSTTKLTAECARDFRALDSFVIYVCMEGTARVYYGNGLYETLQSGETCLLPCGIQEVMLRTETDCLLLETYIH